MTQDVQERKRTLKTVYKALKGNAHNAELHRAAAALNEQLEWYKEAVPHLAFLASKTSGADEHLYARYVRALQRSMAPAKSLDVCDQGLKLFPNSSVLLKNRALTLQMLGRFEEAGETYANLSALEATDEHSAGMAGTMKFLHSDMQDGFDEYAKRPLDKALATLFDGIPRWNGESLAGRKIVLWSEQGVGDAMMFLGMVAWVVAQKPVLSLVITTKLAPLVARSFPGVEIISEGGLRGMGKGFDFHAPLGDLMRHALPGFTPASHCPYLVADTEKARKLREIYLSYAQERGRTRLVGLSWYTTNPEVGFTRNISLTELQPILSVAGIQFVSLQYGDHGEEIGESNRRTKDALLKDASIDAFNDLDGLAAQMAAVDEIVSIDNATVHMAGALGVPTTLLLSTMPDWRWGLTGTDCRWYHSVRMERQEALLKWQPVIKRVLTRLLEARPTR